MNESRAVALKSGESLPNWYVEVPDLVQNGASMRSLEFAMSREAGGGESSLGRG